MKYVILFGLLGIIYLIYRGISKYLDYAAKVLLTVLPVSVIVYILTINIPYNELLILPVVGYMMASILDKEDEENENMKTLNMISFVAMPFLVIVAGLLHNQIVWNVAIASIGYSGCWNYLIVKEG
jgi:membrane protein